MADQRERPETLEYKDTTWVDTSILDRPSFRRRRCSIMVEILDKHISAVDIYKMMDAGMNVVKLMTSLSSEYDRSMLLGKIEKAAKTCADRRNVAYWPAGTVGGLKTSLVRTGLLEDDTEDCILEEGTEVILTNDIKYYDKCNESRVFIDNKHLQQEIKPGLLVTIDEGVIAMKCKEVMDKSNVKLVVTQSGQLRNTVPVCVRGAVRQRPVVTKKDMQLLQFMCDNEVDGVIIYYVRQVETVRTARMLISRHPRKPAIISAVCTEQGLRNFDSIIEESDGIVFAREYLAYELPPALQFRLLRIQKWMTGKCLRAGKPIYVSGDVLKKVTLQGIVTSNQIMSVANAVLDGVSGFVIRGGSNIDNVLLAIRVMNKICCDIEPQLNAKYNIRTHIDNLAMPVNAAEAALMACATTAHLTMARIVIVPTVTGITAKGLSRYMPNCIIMAVSSDLCVIRHLTLYRSIFPLRYVSPNKTHGTSQDRVNFALQYAVEMNWIEFGDFYVTLQRGTDLCSYCDLVRVWTVDINKKPRVECEEEESEGKESFYSAMPSVHHED